jgi:hypothetical protein
MPVYVNIDQCFLHGIILFSWRTGNLQMLAGSSLGLALLMDPASVSNEKDAERLERSQMSILIMDVMIAFPSSFDFLVCRSRRMRPGLLIDHHQVLDRLNTFSLNVVRIIALSNIPLNINWRQAQFPQSAPPLPPATM